MSMFDQSDLPPDERTRLLAEPLGVQDVVEAMMHDHPHPQPMVPIPTRFRFTFKRRFWWNEVHADVVASQVIGDTNMTYMLTKAGEVTHAVPLRGRRVLIEPQ